MGLMAPLRLAERVHPLLRDLLGTNVDLVAYVSVRPYAGWL
jgi:hypothetical protein